MNSVKNTLNKAVCISNCYFWTDSQVTFCLVATHNKEFKTFIENRIKKFVKKYIKVYKSL